MENAISEVSPELHHFMSSILAAFPPNIPYALSPIRPVDWHVYHRFPDYSVICEGLRVINNSRFL